MYRSFMLLACAFLLTGCAMFTRLPDTATPEQKAEHAARVQAESDALAAGAAAFMPLIPPPWNLIVPLAVGALGAAGVIVRRKP